MGKPCAVTFAAVTVIVLIAAAVSAIVVGVVMLGRSAAPDGWSMLQEAEFGDQDVPVYKMRSRRSGESNISNVEGLPLSLNLTPQA